MTVAPRQRVRRTQAERRAQTRDALLESAARGLSRVGYGNLVLEQVAREAGYSRGALYHLFADKEELALAVVAWVEETWYAEMAPLMAEQTDPRGALLAVARAHAVFCRRDVARVAMNLRAEFSGRDHPVGEAVQGAVDRVVGDCARLITAARRNGTIPPGPPARVLALAIVGAVEGLVVNLAGRAPLDARLAERVVASLVGVADQAVR